MTDIPTSQPDSGDKYQFAIPGEASPASPLTDAAIPRAGQEHLPPSGRRLDSPPEVVNNYYYDCVIEGQAPLASMPGAYRNIGYGSLHDGAAPLVPPAPEYPFSSATPYQWGNTNNQYQFMPSTTPAQFYSSFQYPGCQYGMNQGNAWNYSYYNSPQLQSGYYNPAAGFATPQVSQFNPYYSGYEVAPPVYNQNAGNQLGLAALAGGAGLYMDSLRPGHRRADSTLRDVGVGSMVAGGLDMALSGNSSNSSFGNDAAAIFAGLDLGMMGGMGQPYFGGAPRFWHHDHDRHASPSYYRGDQQQRAPRQPRSIKPPSPTTSPELPPSLSPPTPPSQGPEYTLW